LTLLENRIEKHDGEIKAIFNAIRQLHPVRDYGLCTIRT
jgi:hypothetical protein